MTSYLIDLVLLAALVLTSWRTGRMYKELRALRSGRDGLGQALAEADRAIDRAAHSMAVMKGEGVRTLQALEAQNEAAREAADRLERLIGEADRRGAPVRLHTSLDG